MTTQVDIQVDRIDPEDPRSRYDISFENGDFTITEGFDTALQMSVFGERRAAASEMPPAERRRGWWGNLFGDVQGYEIGSKIWLLYQARRTLTTLNAAIDYARIATRWLVEDGHLDRVEVSGEFTNDGIRLRIDLLRDQNIVQSRFFDLWEATGTGRV